MLRFGRETKKGIVRALKQWCMRRLYKCMQRIWAGYGSDQGCFRLPSIKQCTNQFLGDTLPHSLVKIPHGLCLIESVASIMEVSLRQFVSEARGCFWSVVFALVSVLQSVLSDV